MRRRAPDSSKLTRAEAARNGVVPLSASPQRRMCAPDYSTIRGRCHTMISLHDASMSATPLVPFARLRGEAHLRAQRSRQHIMTPLVGGFEQRQHNVLFAVRTQALTKGI